MLTQLLNLGKLGLPSGAVQKTYLKHLKSAKGYELT
jgi:hypothetical protein